MTTKRPPGRPPGKTYEPRKILSLRPDTWRRVKAAAKAEGATVAWWLRNTVRLALGLDQEE